MNDLDRIARIVDHCKADVSIEWNQHRQNYHRPSEEVDLLDYDVPLVIQGEMDARNTMVVIHAYPDTPNSSYVVAHWDLAAALDEMWKALDLRCSGSGRPASPAAQTLPTAGPTGRSRPPG